MAGVHDKALVELRAWLGIDNTTPLFDTRSSHSNRGELLAVALREAENLDLTRGGKPRLRPGFSLSQALTRGHSAYAPPGATWAVLVNDGFLSTWAPGAAPVELRAVHPSARMSYVWLPYGIAWSNGVQIGLITDDRDQVPLAPENPPSQPLLAAVTGGALRAGRYQVAITFVDSMGRESGTGTASVVDVADGQSIALTGIPQPTDPIVTTVRIYATDANGTELLFRATTAAGATTFTLGAIEDGRRLETQHLEPIPPGQVLGKHAARSLVGRGRVLLWSPALRYGQFRRATSWLRFPSAITMIAGVGDGEGGSGVWVGTQQGTFWLAGADPARWTLEKAWGYGVQPGGFLIASGTDVGLERTGDVVVFVTTQGVLTAGLPGGTLTPLSQDRFYMDVGQRVAMHLRTHKGERHLVATMQGGQRSQGAVSDRVSVTVYDHTGALVS